MQEFEYLCPACGGTLYRNSVEPEVESFCATKGKNVKLQRVT